MRTVLTKIVIVLVACLTPIWSMSSAIAVDLVNKGRQDRQVTLVTQEGRKSVTVPAGGTLEHACDACTVEDNSKRKRQASGDQTVTFMGQLMLVSGEP